MQYFSLDAKMVLEHVLSRNSGLTSAEIENRRQLHGLNKLKEGKKQSLSKKFFAQFKDLMVIILIVSAAISITLSIVSKNYGDLFEGGVIIFIVLLNAILGVVQENKAETALESLKKRTEPYCQVIRDGVMQDVKVEDLTIGDIVCLTAGNIVPADLRLLETCNFKVDESSLTGESMATEKFADCVLDINTNLAERKNMAYSGTVVIYGRATGVVVGIGKDTEMGKIATMLESGKKEQTPLQKSLSKIGKIISISVLVIAIVIFIIELIVPKSPDFMSAFLTAVALAVAAIPESMPAAITIIMALGVQKLADKNAIIKRLHAVETLGSCQVICTDKTGTLTQNKMIVQELFYNNNTVVKASQQDGLQKHFKEIINNIVLCNDSHITNGKINGEPTETALFKFAQDSGFDVSKIVECNKRVFEIPFDSTRKIMSTVNIVDGVVNMYTKGAYDFLIDKCSQILVGGKVEKLNKTHLLQIEKANKSMTSKALRVLCLAYKPLQNSGNYKDIKEDDLIFLGLIGMIDPPRPETFKAIKDCYKAGLKPVMITGDHADTAFAIAKQIGIAVNKNQVISGNQLNKLTDLQLANCITKYTVFARVSPEHKVRIVKAFKKQGKIVAMTGDGVNDAPSIKIADIGVGMGITGTDVTKDVADMIITDDNFATIIVAVKEGRKIYSNIQKTIQFLLSTNAVEVFTLFLTSIFLPQYVFLVPSQLLFINFITDSLPAISLGLEPAEPDIMEYPPRDSKLNIISLDIWAKMLYQAGIQIVVVISIYVLGINMYNPQTASTMAFLTINIMQLLHAVNLKTNHSIFKVNLFKNKVFNYSFLIGLLLVLMVGLIPALQQVFGIVALNLTQWLIVVAFSVSIIPFVEFAKFLYFKFATQRIK